MTLTTASKIPHFWLFAGSDDFLVQRQGQIQFDKVTEGQDTYAYDIINANAQNVAEVEKIIHQALELLQTQSLFSEQKIIWIKNMNFLGDSVTGRAEGTKILLQKLIKAIEQKKDTKTQLIITAFPVDRRKKEYKALEALGISEYFESPQSIEEALPYFKKEAETQNIQLEPAAIALLYEKVHGSLRMAINEIQKLATFIGPEGTITAQQVEAFVSTFGEVDFFYAAETFFSNNLQNALKALREHYFIHKEIRSLLSALQNRTRLLIQLRTLIDAGQLKIKGSQIDKTSLTQAAVTYPFKHAEKTTLNCFSQNPWYLGKVAQSLNKKSLKSLVDQQMAFLETFKAILKQPENALEITEALYIKLLT